MDGWVLGVTKLHRDKMSFKCARMQHVLVVNSYPDPSFRNPVPSLVVRITVRSPVLVFPKVPAIGCIPNFESVMIVGSTLFSGTC